MSKILSLIFIVRFLRRYDVVKLTIGKIFKPSFRGWKESIFLRWGRGKKIKSGKSLASYLLMAASSYEYRGCGIFRVLFELLLILRETKNRFISVRGTASCLRYYVFGVKFTLLRLVGILKNFGIFAVLRNFLIWHDARITVSRWVFFLPCLSYRDECIVWLNGM